MNPPDYEVVGMATARLKAANVASGRAYYHPPPGAVLPYVVTEDTSVRRADTVGNEAVEVDLTIHVWTEGGNPLQDARKIADEVAQALHGYALNLPDNRLVTMDHRNTLVFYDSDNTTGHGVVQCTAYVDRA